MGPSYFWRGLTHADPPLFRTLVEYVRQPIKIQRAVVYAKPPAPAKCIQRHTIISSVLSCRNVMRPSVVIVGRHVSNSISGRTTDQRHGSYEVASGTGRRGVDTGQVDVDRLWPSHHSWTGVIKGVYCMNTEKCFVETSSVCRQHCAKCYTDQSECDNMINYSRVVYMSLINQGCQPSSASWPCCDYEIAFVSSHMRPIFSIIFIFFIKRLVQLGYGFYAFPPLFLLIQCIDWLAKYWSVWNMRDAVHRCLFVEETDVQRQ